MGFRLSKKKDGQRDRAGRAVRIVRYMWLAFVGLGLVIAIFMMLIYHGVIGYMPPIEELEDPHDKLASVLYASDGTTEIGRFYEGAGNRVYVNYDHVSQSVIDALIATEDVRFYDHSGVD
ncbi:MAG: transglycosylase domain-containing protein, partial [Lepagella sp.]